MLNPSIARRSAWGDAEASSLDWGSDMNGTPAGLEKRDEKLFGNRRLMGAPSASGVEDIVVVANPSARKRQVQNPKNKKPRTKAGSSKAVQASAAPPPPPPSPKAAGNPLVDHQDGMREFELLCHRCYSVDSPRTNR